MSGPSQDVLLDSNAYFRLGNSIRPLLAQSFGSSPNYSLHVGLSNLTRAGSGEELDDLPNLNFCEKFRLLRRP